MKSSFLSVGIWLAIFIAAFAGYGAWYRVIADKSITVAALQNQIAAKTETAVRIVTARTALAEIAGDEATVQSYFVPETGVVAFIDDLEKRARAQGATMKVLSVSVGGAGETPTLVLSLSIDGAFDPVMRTIGAIEYAPYDISLSKLSVAKSGKIDWDAGLEITVGSVPASTATTTPRTP